MVGLATYPSRTTITRMREDDPGPETMFTYVSAERMPTTTLCAPFAPWSSSQRGLLILPRGIVSGGAQCLYAAQPDCEAVPTDDVPVHQIDPE